MFGKSTLNQKKAVDISLIVLVFALIFCQCRRQVLAAQEEQAADIRSAVPPRVTPTPPSPPRPQPSPRPTPPAPLPRVGTPDNVWVVEGESEAHEDSFSCRVACRPAWNGRVFEILQATRGAEDWISLQDTFAGCTAESTSFRGQFLRGGHWRTPPDTPEAALCFLVIRQHRGNPEP